MQGGNNQCAMEIDSGMEGLPLPEPQRVQKPKRKWDPDMELTYEQKAVLVLDICREQVARCYPEGCNVVPTSFFDIAKESRSSSVVPYQSSNKTFNSSCAVTESLRDVFLWYMSNMPQKYDGELSDDDKMKVLHLVRCQEFTEYDPKLGWDVCTRFCHFNMAFFDFDAESKVGLGPPINKLTRSDLRSLETSTNVISLKIIESDLGYPLNVFGTVIARDEVDYKCIYLFKRDREDPQLINSSNDVLNLTGPYRGFTVSGVMYFEYNLKICDDTGDITLSKGVTEFNFARYQETTIRKNFGSYLSTMELVLTRVYCALEAAVTINVLKGPPDFCGRITAWTTGIKDHIISIDNEASGTKKSTRKGGSAVLSRVVSVGLGEQLMLCFSVVGCDQIVLTLGQDWKNGTCKIGSYELHVEVSWTANLSSRRKKATKMFGSQRVVV